MLAPLGGVPLICRIVSANLYHTPVRRASSLFHCVHPRNSLKSAVPPPGSARGCGDRKAGRDQCPRYPAVKPAVAVHDGLVFGVEKSGGLNVAMSFMKVGLSWIDTRLLQKRLQDAHEGRCD